MAENVPVVPEAPVEAENQNPQARGNARNEGRRGGRPVRASNRIGPVSSTPRDFEGATPLVGGILGLRSENMIKKVNYDQFCEKLYIYIVNNFKNGDAIVEVTRNCSATIIDDFIVTHKPKELSDEDKKSDIEVEIKREEIKEFVKGLSLVKSNLKKLYSLVYGNCTDGVHTMLKADSEYDEKSRVFDYEWLFKKVKSIVSGLDTKVNLRVSLHASMLNFLTMRQGESETNDDYLTRFKSSAETLNLAGGEHIFVSKEMLKVDDLSSTSKKEKNEEKDRFMAACFILRCDGFGERSRYKNLLEDLKSSANRGRDEYPTTLTAAFDLLVRESGEYDTVRGFNTRYRNNQGRGGGRGRGRGFLFAQQGRGDENNRNERNQYSRRNEDESNEVVAGADGQTHQDITCFGCQFIGHFRNQCPYAVNEQVQAVHIGCTLAQDTAFTIPKSWLLLDTCSTCDVSNNPELVNNVRVCSAKNVLTAYTNGGTQKYEKVADLRLLPITVHFKKDSMATILSLKSVSEIPGARITLDTDVSKTSLFSCQMGALLYLNNTILVYITTTQKFL